jgi:hypothetical protein
MKLKWHIIAIVLFFIGSFLVGISAYHIIEGWSYLDSTYFLVVTATTIGYGDIAPITNTGKIITIIYSFIGIAFAFYMISLISHYVFERKIEKHLGRKNINE